MWVGRQWHTAARCCGCRPSRMHPAALLCRPVLPPAHIVVPEERAQVGYVGGAATGGIAWLAHVVLHLQRQKRVAGRGNTVGGCAGRSVAWRDMAAGWQAGRRMKGSSLLPANHLQAASTASRTSHSQRSVLPGMRSYALIWA